MPTKLTLPFPPLVSLELAGDLVWDVLRQHAGPRLADGVSLCILRPGEPPDRGGYFFHVRVVGPDVKFSTFDRADVLTLSEGAAVRFMNHVAGRRYDEEMWRLAQKVNLRTDAASA